MVRRRSRLLKRLALKRPAPRRRLCLKCDDPIEGGHLCVPCQKSNARLDETFVDRGAVRISHGDA